MKDAYPLPRVEDALDYLNGAKWFSTLDLASAYWQVAMDPDSVDKTAFATHIGLYEWLVMPFGLSNAPATCERLMEQIFVGLQWRGVLVYLDDLVAYGTDWSSALSLLREVFQRLRDANLKLKPSKCFLMRQDAEYLGHRVSAKGVSPSDAKTSAIRHWPEPASIDEVRSFLGLTGYYRRFVENYAEKAQPLTSLLKKNVRYVWGNAQSEAFRTLREDLIHYPVLGTIQRTGRLILDTDASDYAVGAVLSQEQDGHERVLAYYSKTLNDAQTRYCTTKKELLAVKMGLENWDHYLQNPGETFLIRTDHAALKWLVSMATTDRSLSRWATFVSGYNYTCEHRPGRLHTNADALSRVRYRSCEYSGCTDCAPGSNIFQIPDGEEEVKREDSELVIDPPSRKTSFLHAKVTTRRQLLKQTEAKLPADAPASRTRSKTKSAEGPPPCKSADGAPRDDQRSVASGSKRRGKAAKPSVQPSSRPERVSKGKRYQRQRPLRRRGRRKRRKSSEFLIPEAPPVPSVGEPEAQTTETGPELTDETAHADSDGCSEHDSGDSVKDGTSGSEIGGEVAVDGRTGKSVECGSPPPSFDKAIRNSNKKVDEMMAQIDWEARQREDPDLQRVISFVEKRTTPTRKELVGESAELQALCYSLPLLRVVDGVLRYFRKEPDDRPITSVLRLLGRVVVPQSERRGLVALVHQTTAHLSARRIYPLFIERFWWPSMGSDLKTWIRCCELCQQIKAGDKRGRYPLASERCGHPMDRLSWDISGPWPASDGGNKYILAITDHFSKWLELTALPDKTAQSVASALHKFVSRYGVMSRLHSDRGTEFVASVNRHLCFLMGIKQTFTSGYAPWSNAQVERGNRTVRSMLQALTRMRKQEWDECLPYVMQAYNGTIHASTGFTPFLLMHSHCQNPRVPIDLLLQPPAETQLERDVSCFSEYVEEQRTRIQQAYALVREQLNKSAELQARMHERGGLRVHQYDVGSEVWYYYPPNVSNKLGSPWIGPFTVLATDSSKNLVKVLLRGVERWVNGANVKPVRRLEDGTFLDQ